MIMVVTTTESVRNVTIALVDAMKERVESALIKAGNAAVSVREEPILTKRIKK